MKRPLLFASLSVFAVVVLGALIALVLVTPALGAPLVQETKPVIAQPAPDAIVRDVVQIIGTATHPQFQRYELYYAPFPVPSDQSWIFIGDAHNNQQPLGLLGNWDSRSVPDGAYALRVRVVRADGNYIDSEPRRVVVANTGPVETPAPPTPETPAVEMPPTEAPADAPAVVEQPTVAGQEPLVVQVPTIAPTPTLEVTPDPQAQTTPSSSTTPGSATSTRSAGTTTTAGGSDTTGGQSETATSIANQLFSGSRLMDTAKKAAIYTAGAFVVAGLFFGLKGILVWLWYKIKP